MNMKGGKNKYQLRKPTSEATYNQLPATLRARPSASLTARIPALKATSCLYLALTVLAYRLRGSHSMIRGFSATDQSKLYDGDLMGASWPLAQGNRHMLKLRARYPLAPRWWAANSPLGCKVFLPSFAGFGRPQAALSCASFSHPATLIARVPGADAPPRQSIALLILRPCWPVGSAFLLDLIYHLIGGMHRHHVVAPHKAKGIKRPMPYRHPLAPPHRLPRKGRVVVDTLRTFVACLVAPFSQRRLESVIKVTQFD